jgi:hypothetical protein
MNRRTLLLGACAMAATLAGCASTTPAQIVTDLNNLAAAFTNDAALLAPSLGIPQATLDTIDAAVKAIAGIAGSVATSVTMAPVGIQGIFTDVEAIVAAAAPYASLLPGPWTAAIAAAEVLLPALAALVGAVLPTAAADAMLTAKFRASLPRPTVAEAEAVLAGQAQKR